LVSVESTAEGTASSLTGASHDVTLPSKNAGHGIHHGTLGVMILARIRTAPGR
jgi:hypothetical protein